MGANLDLYRSHSKKPYAIGDWGLGPGIDNAGFIQKMGNFVKSHPRVKAIIFYQSESRSSFDLSSRPRAWAAYKKYIVPLG
jgi:cell wall-associated NlpC family hydrolase